MKIEKSSIITFRSTFALMIPSKQVQKGDFPHLLVHGPPGAGKKTRIMSIVRELYGSGVERLRMENMQFEVKSQNFFSFINISQKFKESLFSSLFAADAVQKKTADHDDKQQFSYRS